MGKYKFFLPVDFYPDYKHLGAIHDLKYKFDFNLVINSTKKIGKISCPPNSIAFPFKNHTCCRI